MVKLLGKLEESVAGRCIELPENVILIPGVKSDPISGHISSFTLCLVECQGGACTCVCYELLNPGMAALSGEGGVGDGVVGDESGAEAPTNNGGDETEMTTLGKPEGLKVTLHNNNIQEPSVVFVVKDTTDTDWQKSRYTYSLPLSTAVADLYSAIAKEAGRLCVYTWVPCSTAECVRL